jgi:hypothetical protein
MQVIQTVGQSDDNKILCVTVPVQEANRAYQVVVTIEPNSFVPALTLSDEAPVPRMEGGHLVTGRGWPLGFFERIAGALKDDPIERGDQGEFEIREPLD